MRALLVKLLLYLILGITKASIHLLMAFERRRYKKQPPLSPNIRYTALC